MGKEFEFAEEYRQLFHAEVVNLEDEFFDVRGSHRAPICRIGESHTCGGSAAASLEDSYQGNPKDDVYVDAVRIGESNPWEMEPIYDLTGVNKFTLRTNP